MKLIILLVSFYFSVIEGSDWLKLYQKYHQVKLNSDDSREQREVKENWFDQKLDHFDQSNSSITWKQRFYSNDQFYQPGGPLFIFVGGEWQLDDHFAIGGLMHDIAKEMNGSIFALEHRYYGQSRPVPNVSKENLVYLKYDQAIEDIAEFIRFQKSTIADAQNSSVILVGGSYAGSLVVWFRQRYPDLSTGVWASGAPLFARLDLPEYIEYLFWAIKAAGGSNCSQHLENAFSQTHKNIKEKNFQIVKETFNLCESSDLSNNLDVWNLFSSLVMELNIQDTGASFVENFCPIFLETNMKNPMEAFTITIGKRDSDECYNTSYSSVLEPLKSEDWSGDGMRQWIYQSCQEFGWFQTMILNQSVIIPIDLFEALCKDLFDITISQTDETIKTINIKNKSFWPNVTNTVFTYGEFDPWQILAPSNKTYKMKIISRLGHCNDFNSVHESDSKERKDGATFVTNLIKKWLNPPNNELLNNTKIVKNPN